MTTNIAFPNIGIELNNVGKTITVFGFDIAYYGITIGLGILIALLLVSREAKRTNQNPENYLDLTVVGIVLGFLCARIYYVVFSWDYYKNHMNEIFNLRQGGIAIYGGVIGAVLATILFAKYKKLSALTLMDTACMGLITGQAIGRWGNFFNREAFGGYTNNLLAMKLPTDAVRSSEITDLMYEHMDVIDGISYIQVHPTFLYESLWNFGVLAFLFYYRNKIVFKGELFCMYLISYGLGRAWIEGLRTDQLQFGNGWAVSQLLAVFLVIVTTGVVAYKRYQIRTVNDMLESVRNKPDTQNKKDEQ